MATETFRVVAIDETHNWDNSTLEKYNIKVAFGIYLFREREATHCCSFSPSSWAECLENVFILGDDAEETDCEFARDHLSYEGIGESSCYLEYIEIDSYDRRFLGESFTVKVDARQFKGKGGKQSTEYHDAIWEAARESCAEDMPEYPAITESAVYIAYQAEQSVKRRAENVPVLGGIWENQLPLFVAAAERMGEAETLRLGWWPGWMIAMPKRHPEEVI